MSLPMLGKTEVPEDDGLEGEGVDAEVLPGELGVAAAAVGGIAGDDALQVVTGGGELAAEEAR